MKILMTADPIGGVWTFCLDLIQELAFQDIEVHLAVMGQNLSEHQIEQAQQIPNLNIHASNWKLEWMPNPWEDVARAGEWLLQLNQSIQPDLIHLNNFCHGDLPWNRPVLITVHSCVLSWWQAVKGEPAPTEWDTYHHNVLKGLQAADHIVNISQHMEEQIQEIYGPFQNTSVIYNGIRLQRFKTTKQPFIFSVGRLWDEAKNIGMLNKIAPQLKWPVYIAGENGGTMEYNENVTGLGIVSHAEIKDWMDRASIFVLPARYEPFGLSILEAAQSKCTLVLGNIPSLREIWNNTAMFVDPNDEANLVKSINNLIDTPELSHFLAKKSYIHSKQFDRTEQTRKFFRLYQKLINQA